MTAIILLLASFMHEASPHNLAPRVGALSRLIDSFASAVSPKWYNARANHRAAGEYRRRLTERAMNRLEKDDRSRPRMSSFEGARFDEQRAGMWLTSRLDPDSDFEYGDSLGELWRRCDDEFRNDPYFAGGILLLCDHIVGAGYIPQSQIRPLGGLSKGSARGLSTLLEDHFDLWQAECDPYSRQQFQDLCYQVAFNWCLKGEGWLIESQLGTFENPGSRLIPLVVQSIAPERIETPLSGPVFYRGRPYDYTYDQQRVRFGIERDRPGGVIVAYYIRRTHPGDTVRNTFEYDRIDADRVHHIFDQLWPGQSRGLPPSSPLTGFKDVKEWLVAELVAHNLEAAQVAFVATKGNPNDIVDGLATATNADGTRFTDFYSGQIVYGSAGSDIKWSSPQRPGASFAPYLEAMLRRNGAGLQIPYEELANDFSKTTFSSGKASQNVGDMSKRRRTKKLLRVAVTPTWNRFALECVLTRRVPITLQDFSARRTNFTRASWIVPAREDMQPHVKALAELRQIEGGTKTFAEVFAEKEQRWEDAIYQREEEREALDDAGLPIPGETPEAGGGLATNPAAMTRKPDASARASAIDASIADFMHADGSAAELEAAGVPT